MTAPEREALVKALRDEIWLDVRVKNLLAQAADLIEAQHRHIEMHAGDTLSLDGEIQALRAELEALSAPAVTVTEEALEIIHDIITDLQFDVDDFEDPSTMSFATPERLAFFKRRIQVLSALKSTTPQTGSQE